MLRLARRQLQLDPLRTVLTMLAIGAVLCVILVLQGFEQGQYYQLSRIVLNRGGDLIVAQEGVANFVVVRSSIPQLARAEVESVDGVVSAHPITAIPIIYEQAGKRTPVYVLVYDAWGGPATLAAGNGVTDGRDIVIDRALAKKYGLSIGDAFPVSGFEFRVSGITNEAAFMMPFAFVGYDGMIDLFIESEIAPDLTTFPLLSYMLVELDETADREKAMKEIEAAAPSVDVLSPEAVSANDVGMARAFFAPIMGLLVTIGYFIALLLVGTILYADIKNRLKSFAVLKALGFPISRLFSAVFAQALILFAVAIPVGCLLAVGVGAAIENAAPVYLIRLFDPVAFLQTLAATAVFASIGAFLPLRAIRRCDPMLAFQQG